MERGIFTGKYNYSANTAGLGLEQGRETLKTPLGYPAGLMSRSADWLPEAGRIRVGIAFLKRGRQL